VRMYFHDMLRVTRMSRILDLVILALSSVVAVLDARTGECHSGSLLC